MIPDNTGQFRLYDYSLNWNPSANWMFAFEFIDIRHNKQTLSNFVYISKYKNVCWSMCGYIRKFWTVFTVHNSRVQIFGRVIQRHLNQMRPNECVWMFSVFFFLYVCLFWKLCEIFVWVDQFQLEYICFWTDFFQKIFYKWVSLCSLCICCFFVVFFLFLLMNMFLKKEMQFKYVYDMKIKRFGRY